jgi:hypothetical protein
VALVAGLLIAQNVGSDSVDITASHTAPSAAH